LISLKLKEADLARDLISKGENVFSCYLCGKCSSGCPLTDYYDFLPHQLMRLLQFGQDEKLLSCASIWLCSSCQTCNTRCPQGINVSGVIDFLRIKAMERGVKPKEKAVYLFNKLALADLEKRGRLYELGLALKLNIALLQPFREMGIGFKLLQKGKFKLFPEKAENPEVKLEKNEEKIAYYAGCSLRSTGEEFDRSLKAVFKKAGWGLKEPRGWVCCGSTPLHQTSPYLATLFPMKNIKLFQENGFKGVFAPCAACYSRLKTALFEVKRSSELKEQVEKELEFSLKEEFEVYHLLDFLLKVVGIEKIKEKVVKSWDGIKVACYYGCLISRPPEVTNWPHPEYPLEMEMIMEELGAEPLDWSYKTDCCGASLSLTKSQAVADLVGKIVREAKEVGAEAIIVVCPLCHLNLDSRQPEGEDKIPVIYLTQALGLSFGLEPRELGLSKHLVDPLPFLKFKGFLKGGKVEKEQS